jgi:hypothetical protein
LTWERLIQIVDVAPPKEWVSKIEDFFDTKQKGEVK